MLMGYGSNDNRKGNTGDAQFMICNPILRTYFHLARSQKLLNVCHVCCVQHATACIRGLRLKSKEIDYPPPEYSQCSLKKASSIDRK